MAQKSCSYCGGPFNGGHGSSCSIVRAENKFFHDPNPFPYDNTPNFYDQSLQHHVETYSCDLCGNDSHYGYDFPPRVPLVYEQEPCYSQNFGDNYYPQNSSSFPQKYLYSENCGGPRESFQRQPRNQNFYKPNLCYNYISFSFDQPPQHSINHQPQSIQEDLDQQRMNDECIKSHNDMIESRNKLLNTMQSVYEMILQREQAANPSTHKSEPSRRFNFCYDDDDDEESTIPLNGTISQLPSSIAITPVLPTMEPEESLIVEDEDLCTIPEKESDEFIKSSVEDLVPTPREFEDTSDSDSVRRNREHPYVSNLDEPALLVTPLFDANEDECFDPGGDMIRSMLF
nr:hypothetical protein [Tanacetum cinerariifolium]